MAADSNQLRAQAVAEKTSAIMHENDHCAHTLNLSIDAVLPGCASVSMVVSDKYANGHGYCQGGSITILADTAFAHACNSYNQMTLAQGLSIEFVRSAKVGERLLTIAKEQSRGKLTGVYQVKVSSPDNKIVAIMMGKSFARQSFTFDETVLDEKMFDGTHSTG